MNNTCGDMRRDFERDCRRAAVSRAFKTLAAISVLAALARVLAGCTPAPVVAETAPGMPLDAVRYAPPAFTGNSRSCYRVVDRASGRSWWLVYMGGMVAGKPTRIVLPLGAQDRADQ